MWTYIPNCLTATGTWGTEVSLVRRERRWALVGGRRGCWEGTRSAAPPSRWWNSCIILIYFSRLTFWLSMWKTINSQSVVEFLNILSLWVEKGWTSISSIPYIVGTLMCWIRRAFRRTKKRGQRTMGLWGKKSGLDWARNFRRRGFHLAWGERRKGWLGCEKQKIWRPSYKSCTHLSVFKWQTNCKDRRTNRKR